MLCLPHSPVLKEDTKKFSFFDVNTNEVMRQIWELDKNRSNSGKIPTGVLKATKEASPFYLLALTLHNIIVGSQMN